MQHDSPTLRRRTPLALDDLPDDQLVDALSLLWWLRLINRSWWVRYGSEQYWIAENLVVCGLVTLRFDDGDEDMNAVEVALVRCLEAVR